MWTSETIEDLVTAQRRYFRRNETLDIGWRIAQLKKLKNAVLARQQQLTEALSKDLGRSAAEAYLCDIGVVILEINEIIHNLRRWARPETHYSGLLCFPSIVTKVYKMPYGVTLIISPFNFPVLLSLGVLAAAMGGGNTAVIKASSKSPACTAALKTLIEETFPEEYIAVVDGGHDVADECLARRFDKIFYTGSPKVARHVMNAAAENLTPVALELGGETGNWCIVRADADLKDAARKIAFFKACNSGQVCININQVAVAQEVADVFLKELQAAFEHQLGKDPLQNDEYPKLITHAAYEKCAAEAALYQDRIVFGGRGDGDRRYVPTVFYPIRPDESIVTHELFSPLLPLVPFEDRNVDELLQLIGDREHGLALYLFTRDLSWAKKTMQCQQYGGGCINEVTLQMMVKGVPFNGTGHSGMGAYHGVWGFREFTHPSAVLIGARRGNLSVREHPYGGKAGKLKMLFIRLLER